MGSQNRVNPEYVLKPLPDDGTRGYRVELDEFVADNDLTNIFLVALSEMQTNSLKEVDGKMNLLNYYALSAIHGKPSEDWNNYPNDPKANGKRDRDYGYCHHGMDTFPTWHRPYMMMYERAIYEEMLKQADKYSNAPDKARYHAAAERFRLPYFDPIMPRYKWDPSKPLSNVWGVPEIMRTENVWVRLPSNPQELEQIPNPLYTFKFPSSADFKKSNRKVLTMPDIDDIDENGKKLGTFRFNKQKTVRTPDSNGETNDEELEDRFRDQAVGLANSLWQMLSPDFKDVNQAEVNDVRPWSSFANHSYHRRANDTVINQDGESVANVSLESWHDGIHVAVGGGNYGYTGQMGFPELAGFDPIFWMHHNNIDRLLSLHQAMYGQRMNPDTANIELKPFAKSEDGTCYKSSDSLVADYWSPGFAVPGNKPSDPKTIKQTVSQYITETYYWAINNAGDSSILESWPQPMQYSEALRGNAAEKRPGAVTNVTAVNPKSASLVHRVMRAAPKKEETTVHDEPIQPKSTLARVSAIGNAVPTDAFWTPEQQQAAVTESWNAHIRVRKFAFNRSFAVHVFIGHVKDEQTERFYTKKNEVGFSGIFASGEEFAGQCASCQTNRENDLIYEDVVPLTTQLTDYLASNPKSAGLIRDGDHKTIASLEPEHVRPFLREQLQWRIVDINGELLSGQEQAAQLEVTVTGRNYEAPTPEHIMGVYGEPTIYPDITDNKAGGLGYVYP